MDVKIQDAVTEVAAEYIDQQPIFALTDLQLALIGGGCGDVVFA